jgi:multimeric flavodoxin WrbA
MKAVILLGTLKSTGLSNTETLSEFFINKLSSHSVECELIKLVNLNILPGTYTRLDNDDDWPAVLDKILSADIVIFATPIWWGNHSSEIQKVIERLDHLHDEILEGKKSRLEGKVGGIIITGDSDGAQHIIANIANFFNALGIILPPFTSLSVLNEIQKKGATTTKEELLKMYEEQYSSTADAMVEQLIKFSRSNQ